MVTEIKIDINSPKGNVFYLLGLGKKLLKDMGSKDLIPKMIDEVYKAEDYNKAVDVINSYIGRVGFRIVLND